MSKNCWNCKHASEHFRLSDGNHVHCQHPKYEQKDSEVLKEFQSIGKNQKQHEIQKVLGIV